jgi:hypothetical protein
MPQTSTPPTRLKTKTVPAFAIEGGLAEQLGGKKNKKQRGPSLHDIDIVVHTVLLAEGDWVLVDRNVAKEDHSSTARYIALSRRGFEVASRHVNGVRNIWARWPHDPPRIELDAFSSDRNLMEFGQDGDLSPEAMRRIP